MKLLPDYANLRREELIRDWGTPAIAVSRKLQTQQLSKCSRTEEHVKSQACRLFVLSRHLFRGLVNLAHINDSLHQILAPEDYLLLNQYRIPHLQDAKASRLCVQVHQYLSWESWNMERRFLAFPAPQGGRDASLGLRANTRKLTEDSMDMTGGKTPLHLHGCDSNR